MKNHSPCLHLALILAMIVTGCSESNAAEKADGNHLFNADWKFLRDSISGAEHPDYDDTNWLNVDLPHDYSIMGLPGEDGVDQIGPFTKRSPGNGNATGHVLGGTGWYRKEFTLKTENANKTAILMFDGVYMESEVWVNGRKVGEHKNGYTPFWFDITNALNSSGEPNVIAVKVENNGKNSRWYSGSGIYRNVHLFFDNAVHVAPWGVQVTLTDVNTSTALADVKVAVRNDLEITADARVTCNILNMGGQSVASSSDDISLPGSEQLLSNQLMEIKNPGLWSLESPELYMAEIVIEMNGEVTDRYLQSFGIRTLDISSEKGFLLNGEPLLLKGGCLHHDNGLLGAAAYDRAEIRRVELMKANGFNAIRCSHNPPSEAFLNACDELGILVIDEFTDMWESYKNPQDYSRFFTDHWHADLTNMILRDRNHPSIIMWSIGNEIPKNSVADGVRIGKQLAERVKELDDTRFVTEAVSHIFTPEGWENSGQIFELLDVGGYNYLYNRYEDDHSSFPLRILYASESFPDKAYESWKKAEQCPYVIGDFVWTAMDYLGEAAIANSEYVPEARHTLFALPENITLPPGINIFDMMQGMPSEWPTYLAWCGDLDITGQKKPQSFYRDVLWDNSPVEINVHEPIPEGMAENISGWGWPREFPYWYWPGHENTPLEVRVFTKAPEVKLFLNGELVGEKALNDQDRYIAVFEVPYQPGELKAVALDRGVEVAHKILRTPGEPVAIRLSTEQPGVKADRSDLCYVTIEVIDKDGQVVPQDSLQISIGHSGNGELVASGNASPDDMASFNKTLIKPYKGRAQAIIRPFASAGEIRFSAEADGLTGDEITIEVR